MTAHWTRPTDGAGTWQHTRPHADGLIDLLVATVALLLAGVLFIALVTAGRAAMCRIHADDPQPISYCHPTTTENR